MARKPLVSSRTQSSMSVLNEETETKTLSYLLPEEMVFMMEKNKLETTTMAGVPLSLAKAWDIMLKSGVSLEQVMTAFLNVSKKNP